MQEATQKFKWSYLVAPQDDKNVHRYFENEVLKYRTNSENYTWTFTDLNHISHSSYSYEGTYQTEKEIFNEGAVGILIEIDEKDNTYNSKLLFMISPGHKTFYLGIFSLKNSKWTSFLKSTETGWVFSDAINGLDKSESVSNKLKLKKNR